MPYGMGYEGKTLGPHIDFIDDRLQVFKGRISRDDWVTQAKALKRESSAAKEPR